MIKLIEDTFDGERKEKLLEMYKYFEDRMSIALDLVVKHIITMFYGGWLCRSFDVYVVDCVEDKEVMGRGWWFINFTDEELIFGGMHHELR